MAMTKKQLEVEQKRAGVLSEDTRSARFYYHKVIDTNATYNDAQTKAIVLAEQRSKRVGAIVEPDFSRENLKRLGATNKFKKVVYVEIAHRGLKKKECKSRLATEQDKQFWNEAYLKFKGENNDTEKTISNYQTIPSQRMELGVNTGRLSNDSTQENIGNFNYTFNI